MITLSSEKFQLTSLQQISIFYSFTIHNSIQKLNVNGKIIYCLKNLIFMAVSISAIFNLYEIEDLDRRI